MAEALKRGVADVISCLEKNNEEANEEKKEAVQRAMKQKDADLTIFNLIPKTKEFQYSSKVEKLEPLLQNNPVSYETLLEKLLVPQVHVGMIIGGGK